MKQFCKILSTIIIITLLPIAVKAQQYIEVKNENDLNTVFYRQIARYEDTISNNLKQAGTLFIKFEIKQDGTLDSIKLSVKNPRVLVYAVKEVLKKIKITTPSPTAGKKIYVLPLYYDYQPEPKVIKTAEDLSSQYVAYDMAELLEDMTFDFNGFFKVDESKKDLWGIKCTFLPMVSIRKFRIYH